MKALLTSMAVSLAALTISAPARAMEAYDATSLQVSTMAQARVLGLNWKVGDSLSYNMDIGGFIKGTSTMFVRDDAGDAFWVQQDMDLSMAGKHKVEILFAKADGQIRKMLMDGKEQQAPDSGNTEVVETKEAEVTVPAGSFKCIYVKMRDKKSGDIQEGWINPKEVPISGLLKATGNSQVGKVNEELTSFKRGN